MAETPLEEARREIAHWQSVIDRYEGGSHPLDKMMVESAEENLAEWEGREADLQGL